MRYRLHWLALAALVVALVACDKAPRGVIGESKMTDLLVDMQLADAYIDNRPMDFPDDSTRLLLKQSVFKKHGVTMAQYDTSLVWYAHNMDAYSKVYNSVEEKLKKRFDKLQKVTGEDMQGPRSMSHPEERASGNKHMGGGHRRGYAAVGDTADLWTGTRSYAFTQGLKSGFITFDVVPDAQYKKGDRYQLAYKLARCANDFKVGLAIEYMDGATAIISRPTNSDGWVSIDIQSDSTRMVKRIYGYINYNIKPSKVAYVDSLSLLRTHLNPKNYLVIKAQKLIEP